MELFSGSWESGHKALINKEIPYSGRKSCYCSSIWGQTNSLTFVVLMTIRPWSVSPHKGSEHWALVRCTQQRSPRPSRTDHQSPHVLVFPGSSNNTYFLKINIIKERDPEHISTIRQLNSFPSPKKMPINQNKGENVFIGLHPKPETMVV